MKLKNCRTMAALGMTAALAASATMPAVIYAKVPVVKEETVYAKIDGEGRIQHVIVSDQLKHVIGCSHISDQSELKDIKNVKGEETYEQKGSQLTWKGEEKDICYQGTTKKQLPVGVKITYLLNGEAKKPKDLEGKTGHLQVHFEYENQSRQGEVDTPFLMVTGMVLNQDQYTNVEVTGGKVLSDGERNVVVGMGIPKLKESVFADLADIPNGFEVSADVKNYEPLFITTLATNEYFNQVKPSDIKGMDTMKGEMNELQSASLQLVDGTTVLKNGMDELSAKSGEFTTAVPMLSKGSHSLAAGTAQLETATEELSTGSNRLAAGTKQLQEGSSRLQEGFTTLMGGLETAKGNTECLAAGANQLVQGADGLSNGAEQLQAGLQKLQGGMQETSAVLGKGTSTVQSVLELLQTMNTTNLSEEEMAAVQQAMTGLEQVVLIQNGVDQSFGEGGALENSVVGLQGGVTSLQGGIGQMKAASSQLSGGLERLTGGLDTLYQGTGQTLEGSRVLSAGMEQTNQGVIGIAQGSQAVNRGAGELSKGAEQLDGGVGQLQDKSGQLVRGVEQLDQGAQTLQTGMATFHYTGIEKLTQMFQDDIVNMADRISNVLDTSKAYRNFSGISEDMDGSVKFLLMTES